VNEPSNSQRKDALGHVRYEIEQLVELTAKYQPITKPIRLGDNAELETLLLHVRVLLDFFQHGTRTRKPRKRIFLFSLWFIQLSLGEAEELDDVLAMDFEFKARDIPIPKKHQGRLNKELAHLTYSRAGARWVIVDIAKPLLERCKEFTMHVLSSRVVALYLDDTARDKWVKLDRKLTALILSPPSGAVGQTGNPGP
jgi:hypothetical protein